MNYLILVMYSKKNEFLILFLLSHNVTTEMRKTLLINYMNNVTTIIFFKEKQFSLSILHFNKA